MENSKLITIEISGEQLDALRKLMTENVVGEEKAILQNKAFPVLNLLHIAFDNRDNIKDSSHDLDEANRRITVLTNRVYDLEKEELSFPFRMYLVLGELLEHEPAYRIQQPVEINVYDVGFKIYRRNFKVYARDIICIHSVDKRKKAIYVLYENEDDSISIQVYHFNNNEYKFDTLCRYFDPLSHRLIKVSKSAIVNVEFYEIASDNFLYLNKEWPKLETVKKLKISGKKSEYDTFKRDFLKVKEAYRNHLLAQKRILGYMFHIDSFIENNFTQEL